MDPLGNQVRYTDEYGNPIPGYGTSGYVDHHLIGDFDEHAAGGQRFHGVGDQMFHAGGGQNIHGDLVTPGNQVRYLDSYENSIPGHDTSDYVDHNHIGDFGDCRAGGQEFYGTGGQQLLGGGGQNLHGDGVAPGNQVRYMDEFGNPIPGHGTSGYVDHHHIDDFGEQWAEGQHQHDSGGHQLHVGGGQNVLGDDGVTPGVLRRSYSSSSSSSEDDGFGGRSKKNKAVIKDKIKEKLPGAHKDQNPQMHYDQGVDGKEQMNDKKGLMQKIKAKLHVSHSR